MRVNVYAEEMSDRIEIISKTTGDGTFTGLRFYLELPVTVPVCEKCGCAQGSNADRFGCTTGHTFKPQQFSGPFIHRPGDDDSSAVTFWGKRDLREILKVAMQRLKRHYGDRDIELVLSEEDRQLVLLALAALSLESPGFDHALNQIALRIDNEEGGRAMAYDVFRMTRRKGDERPPF